MSYCSCYGGILCFHSSKSNRQRIATTTYKPISNLKLYKEKERVYNDSVIKLHKGSWLSVHHLYYEVVQEAPISPSFISSNFSIVSISINFGHGLRARRVCAKSIEITVMLKLLIKCQVQLVQQAWSRLGVIHYRLSIRQHVGVLQFETPRGE
jgi:hypothetical protein